MLRKAWFKNRVNYSNPVIRYVNASRLETSVGSKDSPCGGFTIFRPLTINREGTKMTSSMNQLLRTLRGRTKASKGFTIVELLIVIVVIAILVSISVVSYNGIVNVAKDSAVATELNSVTKKVAQFTVESGDIYPTDLADAGVSAQSSEKYQYSYGVSTYCIATIPEKNGSIRKYSIAGGNAQSGSCFSPEECFSADLYGSGLIVTAYSAFNNPPGATNVSC